MVVCVVGLAFLVQPGQMQPRQYDVKIGCLRSGKSSLRRGRDFDRVPLQSENALKLGGVGLIIVDDEDRAFRPPMTMSLPAPRAV